jgi:ketosteroid isomerase-like protein
MGDPTKVVQEFYRAIGSGDVERVVALLSPKLEWTEAERFPYYGGVWRRPQEVVDNLFVPLARDWEGFSVTPKEFIADGDQVVSLGEYGGIYRATKRRMSAPFAHRWVVRDEKIVQFNQYTDTAKVLEAITQ